MSLILDFVDKSKDDHITIKYCTRDNIAGGVIFLPMSAYEWYLSACVGSSSAFKLIARNTTARISKVGTKYQDVYKMKIEFDDGVLYIPEHKFNKSTKAYCFQNVIEVTVYENGIMTYHKYKFLKNYNTRSEAIYYLEKYVKRFIEYYEKELLEDEVVYGDNGLLLYHGDIIYEHRAVFSTVNLGYANYNCYIMSIEKG